MTKIKIICFCFLFVLFNTQGVSAMMPTSPTCPAGGPEAEKYFQLGLDYQNARKGLPWDLNKAEYYYKKALELGNAKAALNLGSMNIHDYFNKPNRAERHEYAVGLFKYAVQIGCPDGYHMLSECAYEGWSLPQSNAMGDKYMRLGAENGSTRAMSNYGAKLFKEGKRKEGKDWLKKALALGFGDAGAHLGGVCYRLEEDAPNIIKYLREGAKLGSKKALIQLDNIYANGLYGQKKDMTYSDKFTEINNGIDDKETAPLIDLDKLAPPRPVAPYKRGNTE